MDNSVPMKGRSQYTGSRVAVSEACHMVPQLLGCFHGPIRREGAVLKMTHQQLFIDGLTDTKQIQFLTL